ncbi:hypothetical protein D3C75_713640 [compost metagenome]
MEFRQPPLQQGFSRGGNGADGQGAVHALGQIADLPGGGIGQLKDFLGPVAEDGSGLGQLKAAGTPVHQPGTQLLLQLLQLLA